MPASMVRLSAGRAEMSDELQALCFFAGANSIFHGEKLLTTGNPDVAADQSLFTRLGIHAMQVDVDSDRKNDSAKPKSVHVSVLEPQEHEVGVSA